jgi:hypothetical protein
LALLAFLASGSVNAVRQRHERPSERLRHADQLAGFAALDMAGWWTADAAFLARLSKAQIAQAVSEGVSPEVAAPLAKLAKGEAVRRAAEALEGRDWLPAPPLCPWNRTAARPGGCAPAAVQGRRWSFVFPGVRTQFEGYPRAGAERASQRWRSAGAKRPVGNSVSCVRGHRRLSAKP